MIKYNDDNIYVGYIKQLLKSFNLPQCQIGFKEEFAGNKRSLNYISGNALYFYDIETKESKRVKSYKFNDRITNITKNLVISTNIYDSYTHEYLGEYLRYLRDYMHLDLMSMYNCFSNVSVNNINIKVNGSEFDSNADSYAIFAVPVKYNQKYTIAIDWHGPIEMFAGLYRDGDRVNSSTFYSSTEYMNLLNIETYDKFTGVRFTEPVVYDKLLTKYLIEKNINPDYSKESCLRLFIKVPNTCKSSIVILEGDYTKDVCMYFNNGKQEIGYKQLLYRPEITKWNIVQARPAVVRTSLHVGEFTPSRNWYTREPSSAGIGYLNDGTYKYTEMRGIIEVLEENSVFLLSSKGIDYSETLISDIISKEIWDANTSSEEYEYISKHQLLQMNSCEHYLIADRLVEYLSDFAITPITQIIENISHLQSKLKYDKDLIIPKDKISFNIKYLGIWDDEIRKCLYRIIQAKNLNSKYFDMLAYVDKDIESSISKYDTIENKSAPESLRSNDTWQSNT